MVKGKIEPTTLYGELALDAAGRSDRAEARSTGSSAVVESESPLKRSAHALAWEMIELQIQMVLDEPEVWVPAPRGDSGTISRKSRGDVGDIPAAGQSRAGSGRQRPQSSRTDGCSTRGRWNIISVNIGPGSRPRAGELGVAAPRGEIWTPESRGGRRRRRNLDTRLGTPPAAGGSKPSIIVTGH